MAPRAGGIHDGGDVIGVCHCCRPTACGSPRCGATGCIAGCCSTGRGVSRGGSSCCRAARGCSTGAGNRVVGTAVGFIGVIMTIIVGVFFFPNRSLVQRFQRATPRREGQNRCHSEAVVEARRCHTLSLCKCKDLIGKLIDFLKFSRKSPILKGGYSDGILDSIMGSYGMIEVSCWAFFIVGRCLGVSTVDSGSGAFR